MFFAVWWRTGHRILPSLAAQVAALMQRPGAVRIDEANVALAVWPPARIRRQGPAATAYAVLDRSSGSPPGHPSARLEGDVLTLAAGPLPQYPLYFAVAPDGGYLLACSQLSPLATLLSNAPLNAQRLISLIAYGADTDTDATVYAGVQRLRPCETIVAERDEIRVTRDFPHIASRYREGEPEDLAAELRQRLDAAVGRAIGASQRIAVSVSGGLDSSGVLALAAARCRGVFRRELDAISVQYAGPGDDRPYFAELTSTLGLAPVRLRPQDAGPWFLQSLCADGQPDNLAATCLALLVGATSVKRDADVVLTGVSGDTLCGGSFPFTHLARRARWVAAVNSAMRLRLPWPMGRLQRLRYVASPLVPRSVRRVKRRLARRPQGPAWLTYRSRDLLARCREADERTADPLPETPDALIKHLCTRGQIADMADVGGQVATLTHCFPVDVFLDVEFVRFMLELDPVVLSHGHQYRGLYRLAMKGLLPERLRMRQDKGYFEPAIAAAAVAADAIDTLRDLSSLEALATRGLADPAPLRPTFDACLAILRRGERDEKLPGDEHIQEVWQLLSVEAFLREHGRGRDLA